MHSKAVGATSRSRSPSEAGKKFSIALITHSLDRSAHLTRNGGRCPPYELVVVKVLLDAQVNETAVVQDAYPRPPRSTDWSPPVPPMAYKHSSVRPGNAGVERLWLSAIIRDLWMTSSSP